VSDVDRRIADAPAHGGSRPGHPGGLAVSNRMRTLPAIWRNASSRHRNEPGILLDWHNCCFSARPAIRAI